MRASRLAIPMIAIAALTLWMMTGEGPRPGVDVRQDRRAEGRTTVEEKAGVSPPSPSSVSVVSPGEVSSEAEEHDAIASDIATITGVVYDISGAISAGSPALEDASVILSLDRPREVSEEIEVRTGPDGHFSVSLPVPSSATLRIAREDFVPFELPGMLFLAPEVRDLGRINLPRGGRILGRVIDERGMVVGGARILVGDDVITEADTDGAFEIRGLPWGILSLRAECEGYSSVSGPELEVQYRINEELRGVVLHLANYRRISGVVRDERGDPIDGVTVSAQLGTDNFQAMKAEKRMGAPLDRWKYEKVLYWLGDELEASGYKSELERLEDLFGVTFRHPYARAKAGWSTVPQWIVKHFAREEGKRPELAPRTRLWRTGSQTFHSATEENVLIATTDRDGHFELMGELVDRRYDLTVHHRGYDPVQFSIQRPSAKEHLIELTRLPWVEFGVTDLRGLPLTPGLVEVRSDFHARDWSLTEFWSEGDRWFAACPENGNWQVRVWAPLHQSAESRTQRLLMGEVKSVGRLALSARETECILVKDEIDGEPVSGAVMTVWIDGVQIERRSDEAGWVCIPLTEDAVEIAVAADGYVPIERYALPREHPKSIELDRSGWLEGTVYGFDDKPIAGVAVGFFPKVPRHIWYRASRNRYTGRSLTRDAPPSAVSDSLGRFRIGDLRTGNGLIVVGEAMPRAWMSITVLSRVNHTPGLPVKIAVGEATRYDVELSKLYGDVGGRVFAHGEPAAGMKVTAYPESYDGRAIEVQTTTEGRFGFPPLIPGTYSLRVTQSGRPLHRSSPFDLSAGDRPRFDLHIEYGALNGRVQAPSETPDPGSVVLHDLDSFEAGGWWTYRSLRTLVKADKTFSFPQVGPGEYVVTGLDRGAGVVPARVRVTADHVSEVSLKAGGSGTVGVLFDWVGSTSRRSVRILIEDSESGLRWPPVIEKHSAEEWTVTGLEACDLLHVTSIRDDDVLVTVNDPFSDREGPIHIEMKLDTEGELVGVVAEEESTEASGSDLEGSAVAGSTDGH